MSEARTSPIGVAADRALELARVDVGDLGWELPRGTAGSGGADAVPGAGQGLHRTVKIGDLIIAAAAEQAGWVVLYYDRDFDRIAELTNQPVDWVTAPGTAD